nr:mediator of RNA polymerase II transcription subunit 9 isoform X1 [Rattus norvegicus]
MASSGVAGGRQAEDTLQPPPELLPESKPPPPPQPLPVAALPPPAAPRPQSPAGVKEENYSFLPLVHNVIKWMGLAALACGLVKEAVVRKTGPKRKQPAQYGAVCMKKHGQGQPGSPPGPERPQNKVPGDAEAHRHHAWHPCEP